MVTSPNRMEKKLYYLSFPRGRILLTGLFFLGLYGFVLSRSSAESITPLTNRDYDPVVVTGADLPNLTNASPDRIVGYRYMDGWEQIPIQIDERKSVKLDEPYGPVADMFNNRASIVTYVDSETFVGADNDPSFDHNDELVFMAKDVGSPISGVYTEPNGVIPDSGMELHIEDPLGEILGYVYLFQVDNGHENTVADAAYVDYQFDLIQGEYLSQYELLNGFNPETSAISTPYYTHTFSDRWIMDSLTIHSGSATGEDILDRYAIQLTPRSCYRNEEVFSRMEGAFLINKTGPIRAIRSYIGASSGPHTQRTHIFYEGRHDVITDFRVHAIPSIMDFMDYAPSAVGMTYFNSHNLDGVLIDGNPEELQSSQMPGWEMVAGSQGSLITVHQTETDISTLNIKSYYNDEGDTPTFTQCVGDDAIYGGSGLWIDSEIPCTDIESPDCGDGTATLQVNRTMYYSPPNESVQSATQFAQQAQNPLQVSAYVLIYDVVSVDLVSQNVDSLQNPLLPFSLIGLLLITSIFIIKIKLKQK